MKIICDDKKSINLWVGILYTSHLSDISASKKKITLVPRAFSLAWLKRAPKARVKALGTRLEKNGQK